MSAETTIKTRRGASSQWASVNPILAAGEPGFETNTLKFKVGDGTTAWNDLPYLKFDGGDIDNIGVPANLLLNFETFSSLMGKVSSLSGGIVDLSTNQFGVTAVGDARIDNSQFAFGTGSLIVESSNDYLSVQHHPFFEIGSSPFTLETRVKINGSIGFYPIISKRASEANYHGFSLYIDNATPKFVASSNGSSWNINLVSDAVISDNSWHHIAVCHNQGVWKLFVDGALKSVQVTLVNIAPNQANLTVGASSATQNSWSNIFWIDALRFAKGISAYSNTFTVPNVAPGSLVKVVESNVVYAIPNAPKTNNVTW